MTAHVRVSAHDSADLTGTDESDGPFEIADATAPVVTVTAPDGGESWVIGSIQTITWSASDNVGVTGFDLDYSTDGGALWTANFLDENEDSFLGSDSRFDPNVAFDSDGNAYVIYSIKGSTNRVLVAMSADGGQNFNQVTTATTDGGSSNLHTAMVTT